MTDLRHIIFSDTELKEEISSSVVEKGTSKLIVHNDNVNTFEWVIESLVEVCGHSSVQAEQCTYIIHYKGKAAVKEGDKGKLKPLKDALIERGIGTTIE